MTNDEIKAMALECGLFTLPGYPDLREYVYAFANRLLVKQYEDMLAEGYRFCAKGQHTSQFCGQLEEAVAKAVREERDAWPNLQPVITWLENGCDPKEAAKELRIYDEALRARGNK